MPRPILILDKSAFQGLSRNEHTWLQYHFRSNTTPVLVHELVGDLKKHMKGGLAAEKGVAILAEKFCGSGGVVNMDYRTLCIAALLGNDVPCNRRIIPDNMQLIDSAVGGSAALVDLSGANYAILRLARQSPTHEDREFASKWRQATRNLSLHDVDSFLRKKGIRPPRIRTAEEGLEIADELVHDPRLLRSWVEWLLSQLRPLHKYSDEIQVRASALGGSLTSFAPYASHCMRATLLLVLASRSTIIPVGRVTNLVDLQYLFYLPFCEVFASGDKLHRVLAPVLVDYDQSFIPQRDLKKWVKQIASFYESLPAEERRLLDGVLAPRPPPLLDNGAWDLWEKHSGPWTPDQGNHAIELSDAERAQGHALVHKMLAARAAGATEQEEP